MGACDSSFAKDRNIENLRAIVAEICACRRCLCYVKASGLPNAKRGWPFVVYGLVGVRFQGILAIQLVVFRFFIQ